MPHSTACRRASVQAHGRPVRRRHRRAAPSACPPLPRPGSVLVGTDDSGVDAEVSGDQAARVRPGLEGGEDPLPGAVPLPTAEQIVRPGPHGPYSAGMSLRGRPVRTRKRMPSISCRRVHVGGRPVFFPFGDNGSGTAHCSFVRSPGATNRDHPTLMIHFRHTPEPRSPSGVCCSSGCRDRGPG